ncbi:MAG: CerR family C-terminal domain-containing protein [Massilia sp.]|nr:CerR family C-terminal domain-containing protein [Massilia sp.]
MQFSANSTGGDDNRKTRSDGAQSRERLLAAAMHLFAERGFAPTSIREIAAAAGTNIAAIRYYFSDKAGLYRAAFSARAPHGSEEVAALSNPALPLRASLQAFYAMLLGPLKQGDLARLHMRLWLREMLEPTGLWREEIDNGIGPAHAALMLVLGRHLGLAQGSDALARLAFGVVGLALQLILTRDVIDKLAPQLLASDAAIDTWIAQLVDYAEAMVHAEQARMAAPPILPIPLTAPTAPTPPTPPLTRKRPA